MSRLTAWFGAVAINLLLFTAMHALVRPPRDALVEAIPSLRVALVHDVPPPEQPPPEPTVAPPPMPSAARIPDLPAPLPSPMAPPLDANLDSLGRTLQSLAPTDFAAAIGDIGEVPSDLGLSGLDSNAWAGSSSSAPPRAPSLRVPPSYPPRALARGIEGVVVVEFTITPSGHVIDAIVDKANPPKIFDSAALAAVRRWRYDRSARAERTRITLRFELEE